MAIRKKTIVELSADYPVWMSDVVTLTDALHMIREVGAVTGTSNRAGELLRQLDDSLALLIRPKPLRVLYLIWRNPWMAAGDETFINSMLVRAGFTNAVRTARYPELTDEEIRQLNPEVIFLSSEPYPFEEKHKILLSEIVPGAHVVLVHGEVFSWYGSRLLQFADYVNRLIPQLP